MPEPIDETVRSLIIALLDMPMDAIVSVWPPAVPLAPLRIHKVTHQKTDGWAEQYVALEAENA
jgi:hypothetical protein